jgi:hypothetical protein
MIILNEGILDVDIPPRAEREFSSVDFGVAAPRPFNAKFFETVPTMWAQAHAFESSLVAGDPRAVEEWACLFALDYFGIVRFRWIDGAAVRASYDKDLWPALSGTYPRPANDELGRVGVLRADATPVGGYYPTCLVFPARSRAEWSASETLSPYVAAGRLSWAAVQRYLIARPDAAFALRAHLAGIAATLLAGKLRQHLEEFLQSAEAFGATAPAPAQLPQPDRDPAAWNRPFAEKPDPAALLEAYPLKKQSGKGTIYYLVSTLPEKSEWMTWQEAGRTALARYRKVDAKRIDVEHALGTVSCALGEHDRAVELAELFLLDREPFWCRMPKAASSFREFHKKSSSTLGGVFNASGDDTVGVYLFPARPEILEHFPEIAEPGSTAIRSEVDPASAIVEWRVTLLGRELRIRPGATEHLALPELKLAHWPPKYSPSWRLYVARGSGVARQHCGFWSLVGDDGTVARDVQLAPAVYLSVLNTPRRPTQPRALWFHDQDHPDQDKDKHGRGLLFLNGLPEAKGQVGAKADLAMDFGTSNTCVASKLRKGMASEAAPVSYSLSPLMLWGQDPLETPGFAPFEWGGKKGYFPSILLALKSREELKNLKVEDLNPEHLFMVDIPGLHKGLETDFESFEQLWNVYTNLKWRWTFGEAWGYLFVGLSLLYAHAEMCLTHGAEVEDYIFTYPLAFEKTELDDFEDKVKQTVNAIRRFAYGDGAAVKPFKTDESRAMAYAVDAGKDEYTLQVFVDVGGGTTDIAIRHRNDLVVLDSLKIAGRTFFWAADESLEDEGRAGAAKFQAQLERLLHGPEGPPESALNGGGWIDLETKYSLYMNGLDDSAFARREREVFAFARQSGALDEPSYQRFRTLLMFQHVVAYSLLQACAAVAHSETDDRRDLLNVHIIDVTFSGNGWGLLLFAGMPRAQEELKAEAKRLLGLVVAHLAEAADPDVRSRLEGLEIGSVNLLNEERLSKAKTSVAQGALGALRELKGAQTRASADQKLAYTGITITSLRVDKYDPVTLRWCNPWRHEDVTKAIGPSVRGFNHLTFDLPRGTGAPYDPILAIFSRLANPWNSDEDLMPPEEWRSINGKLQDGPYLTNQRLNGTSPVNFFLSGVLYPYKDEKTGEIVGTKRHLHALAKAANCY